MSNTVGDSARKPELPLGVALYHLGIGHYFSRALYVAAKLGLADLLKDGPRDAAEMAKSCEAHAPALNRVMRLLASIGVFEELDGQKFALTPLGCTF